MGAFAGKSAVRPVTISAPGYQTQVLSFTATPLEQPPGSCCWCGGVDPDRLEVTLEPGDDGDGGVPDDDAGS